MKHRQSHESQRKKARAIIAAHRLRCVKNVSSQKAAHARISKFRQPRAALRYISLIRRYIGVFRCAMCESVVSERRWKACAGDHRVCEQCFKKTCCMGKTCPLCIVRDTAINEAHGICPRCDRVMYCAFYCTECETNVCCKCTGEMHCESCDDRMARTCDDCGCVTLCALPRCLCDRPLCTACALTTHDPEFVDRHMCFNCLEAEKFEQCDQCEDWVRHYDLSNCFTCSQDMCPGCHHSEGSCPEREETSDSSDSDSESGIDGEDIMPNAA